MSPLGSQRTMRFENLEERELLATFSSLNQQLEVSNSGQASLEYWRSDNAWLGQPNLANAHGNNSTTPFGQRMEFDNLETPLRATSDFESLLSVLAEDPR